MAFYITLNQLKWILIHKKKKNIKKNTTKAKDIEQLFIPIFELNFQTAEASSTPCCTISLRNKMLANFFQRSEGLHTVKPSQQNTLEICTLETFKNMHWGSYNNVSIIAKNHPGWPLPQISFCWPWCVQVVQCHDFVFFPLWLYHKALRSCSFFQVITTATGSKQHVGLCKVTSCPSILLLCCTRFVVLFLN